VYVLYDDRPLSVYRPNPSEVIGLGVFPLDGLIRVAAGEAKTVTATEAISVTLDGRIEPTRLTVSRDELVPYSAARLRNLDRLNRVDKL
jgi:hypothetical protein